MRTQLKCVVLLWNYNRFVSAVCRLGTCEKCIFHLTVLPWVKFLASIIFCKLIRMSYFPVNFEPLRNHIINFSMRLYKNIYLIGQQCCTMMTASGWSSTVVSTSQETVLFFMLFYQRIWILNVLSKFIHVSNDIKMIIITRFDFTYFDHWLNLSAASTCGQ